MSIEIHRKVTARILNALEQGQVPWGRPWLGHRNDGPPTNTLTSLPFRGVNPLLLNLAGFTSKWWATQRCWRAFGFEVKPDQEGIQVFTGKAESQMVFNAQQVEGLGVERYLVEDTTGKRQPAYEAAEKVIFATAADLRHIKGNQAVYYRLPKDYIVLPLKNQFMRAQSGLPGYFNTAFHELVHHSEHRLGWLADPHLSVKERYRIGELRAHLGSAFLAAEIGIPFYQSVKGHAMFVRTWTQLMKADPTFIFRVAEAAWDGAEFILSFSRNNKPY